MSQRATPYLHGTSASEQGRLSLLNAFLNHSCLEQLALIGSERILDVGAGLLQFSRDMARRVQGDGGCVIAIERDPQQREEGMRQMRDAGEADLIELREGDAYDLPLAKDEWGTFDVVHSRFLLEHLTDPMTAVRQMVLAARPGGRIVLADDDHELMRFWPSMATFERVWRAYHDTFHRLGCDPQVGRKLVSLLVDAGAAPFRNTFVFFGACQGQPTFRAVIENLRDVVNGAAESVLVGNEINRSTYESGLSELESWSTRPDAALWYPMCWAEGRCSLE